MGMITRTARGREACNRGEMCGFIGAGGPTSIWKSAHGPWVPRWIESASGSRSTRTRTPARSCARPAQLPSGSTRRRVVFGLGLAAISIALPPQGASADEPYDVGKPRVIPQGRPEPAGKPPEPLNSDLAFAIGTAGDGLLAQDDIVGDGEIVGRGSLIFVRWQVRLEDGTIISDNRRPTLLRAGFGQGPPGLDAALLGMRSDGSYRRVKGPAGAFYSDITAGERALVRQDDVIYADVRVIQSGQWKR